MERELKFRAWDKERSKMLTKEFLLCPTSPMWSPFINRTNREVERLIDDYLRANGDPFGSGGCWIAEGGDFYGEHLIVMQYTGLKDKNGKDIYEGDYILIEGNTHTVKFDECYFEAYPQKAYANTLKRFADESIVIGNIYENRELIK